MEFMMIALFFMISLFLILQAPCSSSLQIQVQYSHEKAIEIQLSDLPRKLRVTAEVTVKQHEGPGTMSSKKQQNEPVQAGKNKEDKAVMHGSKGTRHEWVEGTDTSQYFTMDYSHVKRRRPIHNKSLPVGP